MTSRLSWSGDRRRPIKDLQSNVRTYFIKKSRNVWIRELLESLFDSFFPDLSTFVIEHQITNNMLNNINSAKVDKFFFEAVVNDVAVFKDTRILSQIREALKHILFIYLFVKIKETTVAILRHWKLYRIFYNDNGSLKALGYYG